MVKKFTKKAFDKAKAIIINEVKRKLRSKPSPTTMSNGSDLEDSIRAKDLKNGFAILMNDYGEWVDKGFGPGKWPGKPYRKAVDNIQSWMERKGVKPKTLKNGKTPTLKQSAFLIARSIANNGIKPYRFIDIVMEKVEPNITKEIEAAYRKDLELELDKKIPKKNK